MTGGTPIPESGFTITVIDSHTGGEPTRVITGGFPELMGDTLAEKRADLVNRFMHIASMVVDEPRGNEAMVAALLSKPQDPRCVAGVIFFDRSTALGMCVHGTIGLIETLRFLGTIDTGRFTIETPVGIITADANEDGTISVANVPSRRLSKDVLVDVPGIGNVTGDIAYGGNTFFLVSMPAFDLDRPLRDLTHDALAIQNAVHAAGFTDVDHIELYGPPILPESDSRNFVLCPSGTYDRSPCGTGTSAKISCLAADGKLEEGEAWIQESITGSQFTAEFTWINRKTSEIAPVITGSATVVARGELLISADEIEAAS